MLTRFKNIDLGIVKPYIIKGNNQSLYIVYFSLYSE